MIFYAAAIAAVFVDQMAQTPISSPCMPSELQDPLSARLFLAALPSVFALVVAWMVFRWNRKNDDRRWVLENRKAEWKELLAFASKVEHFMPSVAIGSELINTVHDPLFRQHLRDMTQAVLKSEFISASKAERIYSSLLKIQIVNEESKGHIEDHTSNAALASQLGKPRPLEAAKNVQNELISLWREIRGFAAEDLDPAHSQGWWKLLVSWRKKRHRVKADDEVPRELQ